MVRALVITLCVISWILAFCDGWIWRGEYGEDLDTSTLNSYNRLVDVESVNDNYEELTVTPTAYPSLSPSTAFIISTIVGTGTASYSGDSGQATSAALNYAEGVAVDSAGTFLIVRTLVSLIFTILLLP